MKPTYLEKLQQPENVDEEQNDQGAGENQKELDCGKVMSKCCGEMLFIALYAVLLVQMIIGCIYQANYGKLQSLMIEFAIAFAFDQLKSFPAQFIIYWIVIRRCGTLAVDFTGKWDDETIVDGGEELSLYASIRKYVNDFIEYPFVSNLIIGMTIFLCLVIFSELSISE